ncbi:MFS transporter [Streptacidiphilus sp. P02-A3a]|nr:MFS transporter [Streptacidiphilus sp. P02-A3a]
MPGAFHRVWAASAVSSLGDGIYFSALPLLALTLTHDSTVFGVMEAVSLLPWLLFGLIGGALVDRWDRRRTMVITDLCRCALLVVAAVASVDGFLNISVLIAIGFLLGIGGVLFDTASVAYLPELLARDQQTLQRANTRLQGTQRALGGFVGPSVGSLLFALSRTVPFAADAASFLFSSLTIRTLPVPPKKPAKPKTFILKDARIGISYVLHHKLLVGLAVRPAIGNFAFGGTTAVLALYAHDTLHLGSAGYGAFLTTQAVGGLAGTFATGWLIRRLGTGGALTLTASVEAAALLGIGVSVNAYCAGAGLVALGAAVGADMTLGPSVRQAIVPDELMGRVTAVSRLTAMSAAPLGALFGGWLAHLVGLRAPFLVGAGVLVLMTGVAARLTSNKRIDDALVKAARVREEAAADTSFLPETA